MKRPTDFLGIKLEVIAAERWQMIEWDYYPGICGGYRGF
jgi:hypothetical protein